MIKNKIATIQPAKNEVKPTRDLRGRRKAAPPAPNTKISTFTSTVLVLLVLLLILASRVLRHDIKEKEDFARRNKRKTST